MIKKIINTEKLFNNGHLTDEGIALWAEALIENREDSLPDSLKEHVDECLECKKSILELYDTLKESETNVEVSKYNESKDKTKNRKFIYRIAATIVILLSIGAILYFLSIAKPDNRQLFAEYFKPYPNVITVKGSNDKLLGAGMYYYDIAKYDSAMMFYDKILKDNPKDSKVLFYKGVCFLATDEPENAIRVFNKIVPDNKSPYKSQAEWYLALAYLKSGNSVKAKELLSKISKRGSNNKNVKRLLRQLE
jgi:tetratricopeptide (TPR) repeat protein